MFILFTLKNTFTVQLLLCPLFNYKRISKLLFTTKLMSCFIRILKRTYWTWK